MSIKCAHCGGSHSRVETVRQCAKEAEESPSLALTSHSSERPQRFQGDRLPAGRYWIGEDVVVVVRVPAEGRWKGRYFVSASNPGGTVEKGIFVKKDREEFLGWLRSQAWQMYMRQYGRRTGNCPACGGKMGNDETKAGVHNIRGPYGSVCYDIVAGQYIEEGN